MIKNKLKLKLNKVKICAVITAISFMISTLGANLYAIPISENTNNKYEEIFNKVNGISSEYGKITSSKDEGSDITVINIQDLHCHLQTQKNISKIISQIAEKYNLKSVYLEGGYGEIDTSWIDQIKEEQLKKQVIEKMLEEGILTGGEYYKLTNDKNAIGLKGIDDEQLHKDNIKRLSWIIANQDKYKEVIEKVKKEINILERIYVNKRNKRFNRDIEKYLSNKIDTKKFYRQLVKYVKDINANPDKYNNITAIKLEEYPNITKFITLRKISNDINVKEVTLQLQMVINELKNKIPYNVYTRLLKETENLSDSQKVVELITLLCEKEGIDLDNKYKYLKVFLQSNKINKELNGVELVHEERQLIGEIRKALSYNDEEYEVTFVLDFSKYFKDYLEYKLTDADWKYFEREYVQFRNLYAKYASVDRIKEIEKDFDELNKYYKINDQRNNIFVENLLKNEKINVLETGKTRHEEEILKDSKEIIIAITGGFHSSELEKILSANKVNTIVITPSIYEGIERATNKYKGIIKEQSKEFQHQALAYKLFSCETDGYHKKYLAKIIINKLGIEKVDILKSIFGDDIDLTEIKELEKKEEDKDFLKRKERAVENYEKPIVAAVDEILKELIKLRDISSLNPNVIDEIMLSMAEALINKGITLSKGQIFEIENSEFFGKDLQNVPAEIYSRMFPSLQKALLLCQTKEGFSLSIPEGIKIIVNNEEKTDNIDVNFKSENVNVKDVRHLLSKALEEGKVVYLSDILKSKNIVCETFDGKKFEAIMRYNKDKAYWELVPYEEIVERYKQIQENIKSKIKDFIDQFVGLSGTKILKNNSVILQLMVLGLIRATQKDGKSKTLKEIVESFQVSDNEPKKEGKIGNIKGYFAEYLVRYFSQTYLLQEEPLFMPVDSNEPGYDLFTKDGYRIQIKAAKAKERTDAQNSEDKDIVGHALDKYPSMPVFATEEIAGYYSHDDNVFSYGISNGFLNSIAEDTFEILNNLTNLTDIEELNFDSQIDYEYLFQEDNNVDKNLLKNFIGLLNLGLGNSISVYKKTEQEQEDFDSYEESKELSIISSLKNKNKTLDLVQETAPIWEELLFRTVPTIVSMINPTIGIPLFLVMQPIFLFSHTIVKWLVNRDSGGLSLKELAKEDIKNLLLPTAALIIPYVISLAIPLLSPAVTTITSKIILTTLSTVVSQTLHYEYNKYQVEESKQLRIHKRQKKEKKKSKNKQQPITSSWIDDKDIRQSEERSEKEIGSGFKKLADLVYERKQLRKEKKKSKSKKQSTSSGWVDDKDIRQPEERTLKEIKNSFIELANSKDSLERKLTIDETKAFLLRSGYTRKEVDEIDFKEGLPNYIADKLKAQNTQILGTTIDSKTSLEENLIQNPILFALAVETFCRVYSKDFGPQSTLADLLEFVERRCRRHGLYEATCTNFRGYFGEIYIANTLIAGVIDDKKVGPIIIRPELPKDSDARGFDLYDIKGNKIQVKTGDDGIVSHHFSKYWKVSEDELDHGLIAIPVLTTKNVKEHYFERDDRVAGIDVTTKTVVNFSHDLVTLLRKVSYEKKFSEAAKKMKLTDIIKSLKGFHTDNYINFEEIMDILGIKYTSKAPVTIDINEKNRQKILNDILNGGDISLLMDKDVVIKIHPDIMHIIHINEKSISVNERIYYTLTREEWSDFGIKNVYKDEQGNIIGIKFREGIEISSLVLDGQPTALEENNVSYSQEQIEILNKESETNGYVNIYFDEKREYIKEKIKKAARENKLLVFHLFKEGYKTKDLTYSQLLEKYKKAHSLISHKIELENIFTNLIEDNEFTKFNLNFFFREMVKNALAHGNNGNLEEPIAVRIKLNDEEDVEQLEVYNFVRETGEDKTFFTDVSFLSGDNMGNEMMRRNPLRDFRTEITEVGNTKIWKASTKTYSYMNKSGKIWEDEYVGIDKNIQEGGKEYFDKYLKDKKVVLRNIINGNIEIIEFRDKDVFRLIDRKSIRSENLKGLIVDFDEQGNIINVKLQDGYEMSSIEIDGEPVGDEKNNLPFTKEQTDCILEDTGANGYVNIYLDDNQDVLRQNILDAVKSNKLIVVHIFRKGFNNGNLTLGQLHDKYRMAYKLLQSDKLKDIFPENTNLDKAIEKHDFINSDFFLKEMLKNCFAHGVHGFLSKPFAFYIRLNSDKQIVKISSYNANTTINAKLQERFKKLMYDALIYEYGAEKKLMRSSLLRNYEYNPNYKIKGISFYKAESVIKTPEEQEQALIEYERQQEKESQKSEAQKQQEEWETFWGLQTRDTVGKLYNRGLTKSLRQYLKQTGKSVENLTEKESAEIREKAEKYRFTLPGLVYGVFLETFTLFSKDFIDAHGEMSFGMKIVVWTIRALSVGIGLTTAFLSLSALPFSTILLAVAFPAIFGLTTISSGFIIHLLWNIGVVLTNNKSLLLKTKEELVTKITPYLSISKINEIFNSSGNHFSIKEKDETTKIERDDAYSIQILEDLKNGIINLPENVQVSLNRLFNGEFNAEDSKIIHDYVFTGLDGTTQKQREKYIKMFSVLYAYKTWNDKFGEDFSDVELENGIKLTFDDWVHICDAHCILTNGNEEDANRYSSTQAAYQSAVTLDLLTDNSTIRNVIDNWDICSTRSTSNFLYIKNIDGKIYSLVIKDKFFIDTVYVIDNAKYENDFYGTLLPSVINRYNPSQENQIDSTIKNNRLFLRVRVDENGEIKGSSSSRGIKSIMKYCVGYDIVNHKFKYCDCMEINGNIVIIDGTSKKIRVSVNIDEQYEFMEYDLSMICSNDIKGINIDEDKKIEIYSDNNTIKLDTTYLTKGILLIEDTNNIVLANNSLNDRNKSQTLASIKEILKDNVEDNEKSNKLFNLINDIFNSKDFKANADNPLIKKFIIGMMNIFDIENLKKIKNIISINNEYSIQAVYLLNRYSHEEIKKNLFRMRDVSMVSQFINKLIDNETEGVNKIADGIIIENLNDSAILPENMGLLNEMLQEGKSAIEVATKIAFKEFRASLSPDFVERHHSMRGKKGAQELRDFITKYDVIEGEGIVKRIIKGILSKLVKGASIIKHIVIDYRYIKESGIEQALQMFGDKTYIDENGQIHIPPVMILDNLEKISEKYELKNTGIKVHGNSIYQVGINGMLVYGAQGIEGSQVSKAINTSGMLKEEIERLLKTKGIEQVKVEVEGIIVEQAEGLRFEEGITVIGSQELQGQSAEYINDYVSSSLEIKRSMGLMYSQKALISLESIKELEQLEQSLKQARARKIISKEQYEKIGLSKEEIIKMREEGIEIYVEENEIKEEYKEKGITGQIIKEKDKSYIYDYYTQEKVEIEEIREGATVIEIENRLLNSDKPIKVGINVLTQAFKKADILSSYTGLDTLIGKMKFTTGIGKITQRDMQSMINNIDYNKIPVIQESKYKELKEAKLEEVKEILSIEETSELGILIKAVLKNEEIENEQINEKIKERVLAKSALKQVNKENGLKDKKMEEMLGKMLLIQIDNKDKETVNIEGSFKGSKEEVIKKIMQEITKAEDKNEIAINTIIEIILIYSEEYKNKQLTRRIDTNDARNYRAMLSAA